MPERGAFPGRSEADGLSSALMRIDRFVSQRLEPAVVADSRPVDIDAWVVGGEPVPFSDARAAVYQPFVVGSPWGDPWDTVWFRVRGVVPAEWHGQSVELDLNLGVVSEYPGFQAEGLAYLPDGTVLKGIHPMNSWVPVTGEVFEVYIEAAANPYVAGDFTFRPTTLGDRSTAGRTPQYVLQTMRLVLRNSEAWELVQDVRALRDLAIELPSASPRRAEILLTLERVVDAVDPDDVASTVHEAREIAAVSLRRPAHFSAHTILAVGHAHIDSAWLWPLRETVRKIARTFANALNLIEQHGQFVFAASSAQHFAWLRESYPALFERVKAAISAGNFVPVGGMWVESDTNLPSGESLVRQLALGKRFFIDNFAVETEEVWLPDSFGYTAALPQLIRASGSRWFLTQKISWNDTNRMPHHSFVWEGIDGSRVFTHFPPTDTYNSDLSANELAHAESNFSEGGQVNTSLALFGWGDGGGGPTREMVAAAIRAHDLEGSPRVELASPRRFFESAEREYLNPPVWSGELYLELHRGVYTSQARLKRGNRRSEALLREAELWSATAAVRVGAPYPHDELDAAWRTTLLHQFHDILPGSSIGWVNQEAERTNAENLHALEKLVVSAQRALVGTGQKPIGFNAGPLSRSGLPALGGASIDVDRSDYVPVECVGDQFVFRCSRTHATVDSAGLLVSLVDVRSNRELIRPGSPGMVLQVFRDHPRQWDAWDIDQETLASPRDAPSPVSMSIDPANGATLVIRRSLGLSVIEQRLKMHDETGALEIDLDIDWHEQEKLLKLAFPLDLRTERATSEIQYGHVHRPVHENTSWDAARFETVAQRWVHVGEPGLGVTIANDVAYGHDIRNRTGADGRPIVVPRVSLLRSAKFPDPNADQGRHEFTLSLRIVDDVKGAIDEGYRLHLPLRTLLGDCDEVAPLVSVSSDHVLVEAVKLADDLSGDLIVRCYESLGARVSAGIETHFGWRTVDEVDLLERVISSERVISVAPDCVSLDLPAFSLVTLRFTRG